MQPTCGTGIEPATASSINWCSTVELTRSPEYRLEPMSGTDTAQPFRVARLPLDGDINGAFLQRDAGGSRTHWMRLCRPPPRRVTSASSNQCPCQESNLVYDLRRVACCPLHLKDNQYPTEESNLARLLRRQSCVLHTRRAFLHSGLPRSALILAIARRPPLLPLPGIEPGPGPSESPMQSATSKNVRRPIGRMKDIRGSLRLQGRRLDSHQLASPKRKNTARRTPFSVEPRRQSARA